MKRDKGFTFFETLVAVVIMCIVAGFLLNIGISGKQTLIDEQITKVATEKVMSEVEYWQGKIYADDISNIQMSGSGRNPYKQVTLDLYRGVCGDLYYGPILPVDFIETKQTPDYYNVPVWMKWKDLNGREREIKLTGVAF